MDAVIFSTFVPSFENIKVAKFYLDSLVENFSDCDIYVGVSSSCKEWLDLLGTYNTKFNNLYYEEVESSKHVDSDACGYQKALELMHIHGKKYDTILFVHTKGVTYNRPDIDNIIGVYKQLFLTKEIRDKVKNIFKDPKIGLYGNTCVKTRGELVVALDRFFSFFYTANTLFVTDSIYYMKGAPVYNFINNCKDFFENNLIDVGCDRYFFERDFCTLPFRFGYGISVENYVAHPVDNYFSKNIFEALIDIWRKENCI